MSLFFPGLISRVHSAAVRRPRPINRLRKIYHLRRIIRNQRIVIIGSGPSAADLPSDLPSDVRILACNLSPIILRERGIKAIDLYVTYQAYFKQRPQVLQLLPYFTIDTFVIDNVVSLWRQRKIVFRRSLQDSWRDQWYLQKLIARTTLRGIFPSSVKPCISSGMRLLQFALFFEAKEIYLFGIDASDEGHYYTNQGVRNIHGDLDTFFAREVSKRFQNIHVASSKSPLKKYFPYRPLLGL